MVIKKSKLIRRKLLIKSSKKKRVPDFLIIKVTAEKSVPIRNGWLKNLKSLNLFQNKNHLGLISSTYRIKEASPILLFYLQ